MKTILFLLLSFACHAQMCEQWEHLDKRNAWKYLTICIPEIIETDSTVTRITPNCNEQKVKCEKCGVWITFGDPETIETWPKKIRGAKLTQEEKNKLKGALSLNAVNGISFVPGDSVILDHEESQLFIIIRNGISDTFDYDKEEKGITLSLEPEPKFESGTIITPDAKLTPIDSIEGDLYAMYPSTWTIDQSYFDTTKIVMLVSDTLKTWQLRDKGMYFIDANPVKWMYGYAIIQSEYCMIACPDDMPGCCVAHYGYGNKKTIGYLDLSKNPISKEIIIWDWKKVK